MTETITSNELKELLSSNLQSLGIDNTTINTLLTDEFINGLLVIKQQEPENSELISLVREFSEVETFGDIQKLSNLMLQEMSYDSYIRHIFTYIRDSWQNISFSDEVVQTRSVATETQRIVAVIGSSLTSIANSAITKLYMLFDSIWGWYNTAQWVHDKQNQYYDIILGRISAERLAMINLNETHTTASRETSPLVLDLDGDGVETVSVAQGTYFDHDGNGFAENTGWVGADDGLLVRDLNENGVIDDGTYKKNRLKSY